MFPTVPRACRTWLRLRAWQVVRINLALWGTLYFVLSPKMMKDTKGVSTW